MAFLRADLAQLAAYQSPHPSAATDLVPLVLDPLDTNESPIDLPAAIKASLASQYQAAIAANRYPDSSQLALKQAVIAYAAQSAKISLETISARQHHFGQRLRRANSLRSHGHLPGRSRLYSSGRTYVFNVCDSGKNAGHHRA